MFTMDSMATSGPPEKRKREAMDDGRDTSIKLEESSSDGKDSVVKHDSDKLFESEVEDDSSEDDEKLSDVDGEETYDEGREPWPQCIAYDGAFQQLRCDLNSLPVEALRIIDDSGCSSARALTLRRHAEELTRVPRANREKIALLGNTGAGKSSLLNSLLDRPDLARAVSAAQSCTYVCTEYECPFPDQETDFAAKIEYFNLPEVQILLDRLVRDYNVWHFERPEELIETEEQEMKRRATTAFKTFRSTFCVRSEVESDRAAREFLESSYNDSGPGAVSSMVGWCKEMLEEQNANDHADLIAHTQDELIRKLKPLTTSSSRFEEPALWPLVRSIRVGIKGPRILDFVVLVDLPGLDDTNQLRVSASLHTMRSCDTLWIVSKIARVTTDTAVDSLLMRFGGGYDMMVVCTGIDQDANDGLAQTMREEGQSIGDYKTLVETEKHHRRCVAQVEKELRSLRAKSSKRGQERRNKRIKQSSQKEQEKLRSAILEREEWLTSARQDLEAVTLEKFKTLVDARNSFAMRRLQEEKREYFTAGRSLEVFCVSNAHYNMLKGTEGMIRPCLDPEMTGIPALREFILRRAAPKQLAALETHISHKYTVFMQGLALWAKSYILDGSDDLLEQVAAPQARIVQVLDRYRHGLVEASKGTIVSAIHDNLDEIVLRAQEELEKKKKMHWCTIRAFVRKDGNHKTSLVPESSWNEEFMAGAKKVIDGKWDVLLVKHRALAERLQEDLVGLVADIAKTVKGHPAYFVLPTDRLENVFEAQIHGIRRSVQEHEVALARQLRNIQLDLTQERPEGFFTQAMAQAYTQAKNTKGTGYKTRVLAIFETHLSLSGPRSPFALMAKGFAQAVARDTDQENSNLNGVISGILQHIYDQFQDLVDERVEDESDKSLSRKFGQFLVQAEPRFEDMKLELKRIKRRHGM